MFSPVEFVIVILSMIAIVTAGVCFLRGYGPQKFLGLIPLVLWIIGYVFLSMAGGESFNNMPKFVSHAVVVLAAVVGVFIVYWGAKGGFRAPRSVGRFKNYQ